MDAQRVPATTTPEYTVPAGGTSRRRLLRLTAASGGAVLVGTALARVAGSSSARAEAPEGQSSAGSWVALVSYQGSPAGQVLLTFLPGGGLVQTTTSHPTRSPGLGAWAPRGDQELDFTYRAFNFDAAGAFTGRVRTRARVTFNASRDGFSARATSENFDVQDNLLASFDVTLAGTRIGVEPLE